MKPQPQPELVRANHPSQNGTPIRDLLFLALALLALALGCIGGWVLRGVLDPSPPLPPGSIEQNGVPDQKEGVPAPEDDAEDGLFNLPWPWSQQERDDDAAAPSATSHFDIGDLSSPQISPGEIRNI